jgi:hypothetical protein
VPPIALDRLPYGLTWDDVAGGLPDFVGNGTAHLTHRKRGRHQGGHESVIVTLGYDAVDGSRRHRTLFLKRNPDEAREAAAYRFLTGRGIAVPELILCSENEDEEVLGLEFLPSIGIEAGDVDDLLRLVATLNAVQGVPRAVGALRPGRPQAEFEELLAHALNQIAGGWPEGRSTTWLQLYRKAARACLTLPQALTHGELAAQQVGRTESGRLVLFDLATAGERPRFADLANVLQALSDLSGDDQRSLVSHYLRHLSEAGGTTCAMEQAWPELMLTRFVQELEALPWRTRLDEADDLQRHVATIVADYPSVLAQIGS